LLLDNVEDKGMTPQRSQNFQRLLVEISAGLRVDHQIIFTTSMVAPELENPRFTVGDLYTADHKSLRIGKLAPRRLV